MGMGEKLASQLWEIRARMEKDGWKIDVLEERGIVIVRGTSPGFHVSPYEGSRPGRIGAKAEADAFREFLENIAPRHGQYLEMLKKES